VTDDEFAIDLGAPWPDDNPDAAAFQFPDFPLAVGAVLRVGTPAGFRWCEVVTVGPDDWVTVRPASCIDDWCARCGYLNEDARHVLACDCGCNILRDMPACQFDPNDVAARDLTVGSKLRAVWVNDDDAGEVPPVGAFVRVRDGGRGVTWEAIGRVLERDAVAVTVELRVVPRT
jgi:hypothetical protein